MPRREKYMKYINEKNNPLSSFLACSAQLIIFGNKRAEKNGGKKKGR